MIWGGHLSHLCAKLFFKSDLVRTEEPAVSERAFVSSRQHSVWGRAWLTLTLTDSGWYIFLPLIARGKQSKVSAEVCNSCHYRRLKSNLLHQVYIIFILRRNNLGYVIFFVALLFMLIAFKILKSTTGADYIIACSAHHNSVLSTRNRHFQQNLSWWLLHILILNHWNTFYRKIT